MSLIIKQQWKKWFLAEVLTCLRNRRVICCDLLTCCRLWSVARSPPWSGPCGSTTTAAAMMSRSTCVAESSQTARTSPNASVSNIATKPSRACTVSGGCRLWPKLMSVAATATPARRWHDSLFQNELNQRPLNGDTHRVQHCLQRFNERNLKTNPTKSTFFRVRLEQTSQILVQLQSWMDLKSKRSNRRNMYLDQGLSGDHLLIHQQRLSNCLQALMFFESPFQIILPDSGADDDRLWNNQPTPL